jgi:lysophospholipase L1-like esterase
MERISTMILCFGDSITAGRPGVTYLKYLKAARRCKNFGLGGDTLVGMTKRLLEAVNDQKYRDVRTIIIGIGTNDVLHPYLKGYSEAWAKIVEKLIRRGSDPCTDEAEFMARYEDLLQKVAASGKKAIIFGIPLLEADIEELNQKAEAYNKVIMELCRKYSADYIDLMGFQREIKKRQNNTGSKFFSKNVFEPVILTILTTYLPFTDFVSRKRGLAVSVDGVHMNTASARGLAVMIDNALSRS